MKTRILSTLITATLLLASTPAIAGPDEDVRDSARALAAKLRADGWPKSRCTTNTPSSNGIITESNGDLLKGDKFLTINGMAAEGATDEQISALLDKIPATDTLSITVRRGDQDVQLTIPCKDIAEYQSTLLTALDFAAKKKWAECVNTLAARPAEIGFLQAKISCAEVARNSESYPIARWVDEFHTRRVAAGDVAIGERREIAEAVLKARLSLNAPTFKTVAAAINAWDNGATWSAIQPDDATLRTAALNGLKRQLIDPQSAMIEMPYDFIWGTWRPFLEPATEGFITCGFVNSKNRMGGYVGSKPFVAVVDKAGFARYIGMDDPTNQYIRPVDTGCAALIRKLNYVGDKGTKPESPTPAAAAPSMAQELEKLAQLRASGALTEQEYAAAKAKILGGT